MNAGEQHRVLVNAVSRFAASPAALSAGDDAHRPVERHGQARSSPSDPASVCVLLAELQVSRKLFIKAINRHIGPATSRIRRAIGFDPNADEKARETVNARAQRMAARAFAGKPQLPADEAAFRLVATDIHVIGLAVSPLIARRKEVERQMTAAARSLPVWRWAKAVMGLGELGLAVTLAETGDPAGYPNFRHMWRRLGLAPFNGKACSVWRRAGGLSAADWEQAGYAPHRRAEIHACVAEPMLKHQIESAKKSATEFGRPRGRYGEAYVARREKTKRDHPDWTKDHAKADAMRIMSKALVADLWAAWREDAA